VGSRRRRFIRLTLKHCQPRFGVRDQLAKDVFLPPGSSRTEERFASA
jgi:hypothetical protein